MIALACGLLFVSQALGDERRGLRLGPGESNWIRDVGRDGSRGVITTTDMSTLTVDDLITALFGSVPPGVTVTDKVFAGDDVAGGTFDNAAVPIGINQGVILSTGNIAAVTGGPYGECNRADNTTTNNGQTGDADLDAVLDPSNTVDRAALTFSISSTTARILGIRYVLGSEEYNEWVGSQYNDGLGIFIDGVDHALVPVFDPVAINTVNCDNAYNPPSGSNCGLYVNNDCDDGGLGGFPCAPPNRETELDGLADVLVALPLVMEEDVEYDVKLVVADNSDRLWDSDGFFKGTLVGGACCIPPPGGEDEYTCVDGVDQAYCTDELGGDDWSEGQLCIDLDPACGVATGACCLPDGTFVVTSEAACDQNQGNYGGDDSTCEPPNGHCCLPDVSCIDTSLQCCNLAGGTYFHGSSCGITGACQFAAIPPDPPYCIVTTQDCCNNAGGLYLGDGTPCAAIGACCMGDGSCQVIMEGDCATAGGEFQGPGTFCVGDNDDDGIDDICEDHPLPGVPGEASHHQYPAEHMTVSSYDDNSGEIVIDFTRACDAAEHNIYYGDLSSVSEHDYSHVACWVGYDGSARFTPVPVLDNIFFVVVGNSDFPEPAEGSYGTDGYGEQRPQDPDISPCYYEQNLDGVVCE
jgi:hypothetical protein